MSLTLFNVPFLNLDFFVVISDKRNIATRHVKKNTLLLWNQCYSWNISVWDVGRTDRQTYSESLVLGLRVGFPLTYSKNKESPKKITYNNISSLQPMEKIFQNVKFANWCIRHNDTILPRLPTACIMEVGLGREPFRQYIMSNQ